MGEDPGNLKHVQAPWDPAQCLKRWLDAGMRNTAGAPVASFVPASAAGPVERIAEKAKQIYKDGKVHIDFSPTAPFFEAIPLEKMLDDVTTARSPKISHSGSPEEVSISSRSGAHETLPPPASPRAR